MFGAPKNGSRYVHDMFTICSFNSPDLDGHRAPKMFHDVH